MDQFGSVESLRVFFSMAQYMVPILFKSNSALCREWRAENLLCDGSHGWFLVRHDF